MTAAAPQGIPVAVLAEIRPADDFGSLIKTEIKGSIQTDSVLSRIVKEF